MSNDKGAKRAAIPEGLRVVVTAGAAGIGGCIARSFAEQGARVSLCDVDQSALASAREALPDAHCAQVDVAERSAVDAYMGAALEALGGLDVLVNNAGIAGPTGAVDAIDPEEWERTIAVNLNSHFYCARRAVPALRESRGAMINISSVAGRLGYAYRTPYAATKWAVVGFTQSLAKELGPDGVRVNAILPGVVAGPRIERVISARAETLGKPYEEVEQEYISKVSLRRMVTAEDIAGMALFLCSPAGANISGQSLSVCGNVEAI